MAVIIISVYAFCFLGNLPYSFRWRTGTCTDHVTNVTLDCIQFSDFVQENLDLWNALVETPFNTCLPIISLVGVTLSNVIIAVRMRSVLAWRKDV
nr:hypothetical protein BaRGS_009203 [Batillaria attramentaria]